MEGRKDDSGKIRMDLVPPDVIEAMAVVLTDGAKRYGDRNWEKGMAWSRPYGALLRHIFAWWKGEDLDPDSGRPHLWHALCCVAFLVDYELKDIGKDDRPLTKMSEKEKEEVIEKLKSIKERKDEKRGPKLADLIDWEEAPFEAKWAAQDSNGDVYWHDSEPVLSQYGTWCSNPGEESFYDNFTLASDWTHALEKPF